MSPPAPAETDAALARLTGTVTEQRPDTELARNLLRLRLVRDAKMRGVPWAAVGAALGGISGKAAKREMKHLAARTQRQLLASKGPRPHGGPYTHALTGPAEGPMYTVEGPGVRVTQD